MEEFLTEVRSSEKNRNLYTQTSSLYGAMIKGKSMKDLSLAMNQNELEEIEEKYIIKRWQSPSIIEALSLPTALRWVIFCTAVFFKYRAVNKRIQLYDDQIDAGEM